MFVCVYKMMYMHTYIILCAEGYDEICIIDISLSLSHSMYVGLVLLLIHQFEVTPLIGENLIATFLVRESAYTEICPNV